MEDLYYILIFDQLDFVGKGVFQISKPNIEQDEETNSTSIVQLKRFDSLGKEISYDIQEMDLIFVKNNVDVIYNGIITKVSNQDQYIEISFKEIINIFDEKISDYNKWISNIQKNTGIEDALQQAIAAFWSIGVYGQNSINANALTHTTVNANIPSENGIFNLATYMNNVKILYDIAIDFELTLMENTTEDYRLIINIYKKNIETKKIIDLSTQKDVLEVYNSSYLACVTAYGPNSEILQYVLLNDRTITPFAEADLNKIVFGKKTSIYVDDWSTAVQEITNQFKGNSYEHLFQFTSVKDYNVGEQIILVTSKGEKVETYISGKKWIDGGFEYKTGKIRVKFLDRFLKEKRG